jgi:hypothetical protein
MTSKYAVSFAPLGPSVSSNEVLQSSAGTTGVISTNLIGTKDRSWAAQEIALQPAVTGIVRDNHALGGSGSNASSVNFNYTTNSSTNGLMVVTVEEAEQTSGACADDTVTGVTYNGSSLTDLGYYVTSSTAGGALKTYYEFAPSQGTHSIAVSASAACIRYVEVTTYVGAKQSGMPDASGAGNPLVDSGSVTDLSESIPNVANNSWDYMCGVPSTGGTITADSGTSIIDQQSGELYCGDAGPEASGTSTIGWSKSSAHWTANYFSFAPAN